MFLRKLPFIALGVLGLWVLTPVSEAAPALSSIKNEMGDLRVRTASYAASLKAGLVPHDSYLTLARAVDQGTERLLTNQIEIEPLLAANDLDPATKSELFTDHFYSVQALALARVDLNLGMSAEWLKPFLLRVPKARAHELSVLFAAIGNDSFGAKFSLYSVKPIEGNRSSEDLLEISLSDAFFSHLSFEQAAKRGSGVDHAILFSKALIVGQYFNTLQGLRYLKSSGQVVFPEIPDALKKEFRGVEGLSRIAEAQHDLSLELTLRQMLGKIPTELPRFLNRGVVRQWTNLWIEAGVEAETRAEVEKAVQEVLRDAERHILPVKLTETLTEYPIPFALLSNDQLKALIKEQWLQVATDSLSISFTEINMRLETALDEDQTNEALGFLRDRAKAIKLKLDEPTEDAIFTRWVLAAKERAHQKLRVQYRQEWLARLKNQAYNYYHFDKNAAVSTVEPALLVTALTDLMDSLEVRPGVSQLFKQGVSRAKTFGEAREVFNHEVMERLPSASTCTETSWGDFFRQKLTLFPGDDQSPRCKNVCLQNGVLNKKCVEHVIEHHSFSTLGIQSANADLREQIAEGMVEDQKKDLENLLELGEEAGFLSPADGKATIVDALSRNVRHQYTAEFKHRIENQFPILKEDVDLDGDEETLLEFLGDSPGKDYLSQEKIEELVDQALVKLEDRIKKNMGNVAVATSAEELRPYIEGSLLMRLVHTVGPGLEKDQRALVEALSQHGLLEQFSDRYLIPYMLSGLAVWGVLRIGGAILRVSPWVTALFEGLDPLVKFYWASQTTVFAADMAIRGHNRYQKYRYQNELEELFKTSAEGPGFITSQGLALARYQNTKGLTWDIFLTVLAGIPVLKALIPGEKLIFATEGGGTLVVKGSDYLQDTLAFNQLKLIPGRWGEIQQGYAKAQAQVWAEQAVATTALERIQAASNMLKAERARELLLSRVASGRAWDLSRLAMQKTAESVSPSVEAPGLMTRLVNLVRAARSRPTPQAGGGQ